MPAKEVNYTVEMEARLAEVYDGQADEATRDAQIAQLADEVGKSAASVRAKLTHMGLYVPKAKAPAGKNTVRKAVIVDAIADKLGVPSEVMESLEKANKVALAHIYNAL